MNHENRNITKYLFNDKTGRVQLIESYGSDLTIVNSARVSFGAKREELSKRDKKLIKYLIEHKHTSVFEHCGLTCKFVVPLFIRSQHHRHRTWSYNEISRRYTNVNMQFYEPSKFRSQSDSNRQASTDILINPKVSYFDVDGGEGRYDWASLAVRNHHEYSLGLYGDLIESGVCREQARGVLPQNLYTEYYGTVNLSNLIKFIDLRLHEGAQWEIQQVAKALLEIAEELWPETIGAFREVGGFKNDS